MMLWLSNNYLGDDIINWQISLKLLSISIMSLQSTVFFVPIFLSVIIKENNVSKN